MHSARLTQMAASTRAHGGPLNCTVMPGAAAAEPFPDKAPTPGQHLKNVFYRMGLGDMEIVALSGAHTLGRAKPDRSGFGKEVTKYTKDGPGTPGARHQASWSQVCLPVANCAQLLQRSEWVA